jgi:hypothetical protein
MKLSLHAISPLEIILFVVFAFYLILSIPTPAGMIPYINSNLGMSIIILVTIYMVFYVTPVLGILTIFVAYELFRRSTNGLSPLVPIAPVPVLFERKKQEEIKQMNKPVEVSLEEEVIRTMAPIRKSEGFVESAYRPTADKLLGGSLV